MASTYSTNLKLELITNGEQAGTWGDTTNKNLGTLLEQAISGYVTLSFASGNQTLTMVDGTSCTARNMFIECTNALSASDLTLPTNRKLYFIYNNSGYIITVKTSGNPGISVPNGAKYILACNGSDIINATSYLPIGSATLTNGYIPKYSSTANGLDNSIVNENTSGVGIGASPSTTAGTYERFIVQGSGTHTDMIFDSGTTNPYGRIVLSLINGPVIAAQTQGGGAQTYLNFVATDFNFSAGAYSNALNISTTGKVGIGKTAATYPLDVVGAARSNALVATSLGTPATPTGSGSSSGGSLAANTYYFKIVALDQLGCVTAASTQSTGVVTTGTTSSIAVSWTALTGASSYQVWYTTTSGTYTNYFTASTNSYTLTTTSGSTTGTISTGNTTGRADTGGDSILVRTAKTPASATDTGTTGQICWDSGYVYVCVATNTWKRAALATW